MNKRFNPDDPNQVINNEKGASAIMTALVIVVLLAFASLAVDVGYMYATANEVQNIADAAALAAARELGRIYENMPVSNQETYNVSGDRTLIVQSAQNVAAQNSAAGATIALPGADILIGTWDPVNRVLNVTDISPDAVQVIARRDAGANGPVTTFLGNIFSLLGGNNQTFAVAKPAAAALSGPGRVYEGELKVPIGLSTAFFDNATDICGEVIDFSGTNVSCAGWHNFFDDANANDMKRKAWELIQGETGTFTGEDGSPLRNGPEWIDWYFTPYVNGIPDTTSTTEAAQIGEDINYSGGDVASLLGGAMLQRDPAAPCSGFTRGVFVDRDGNVENVNNINQLSPFQVLFDFYRMRDGDGNNCIWTCTVPVYNDDCSNPNGSKEIVGFATVEILMPNPPPDNNITANVSCDFTVVAGRGGGGMYGNIKGSIPNLVL